jgi:tRNA pseudouridine32 synthase/23S rRNA pseudouridine746 synthase
MQEDIRSARLRRDNLRQKSADPGLAEALIRESQFQKAELKRLKDKWKVAVEELSGAVEHAENEVAELKLKRARMSDELQRWIFENAVVHNGLGESTTIWDIFRRDGLTPPGGTGECAAPKLLEYAFRHGLKPLAMGEFWYGMSPETAVRTHGHFYPSCTSKCGPLLGYMMQGLEQHCKLHSESGKTADEELRIDSMQSTDLPVIIHEDESVIVVEKPSGMPSVPGLDGRSSLQEWLSENQTPSKRKVYSVHRLDMDTSGVMIFAKNQQAAVNLRRQFEEHSVRKTYMARVLASSKDNVHTCIDLPLAPDYDERPRQKVDFKQGKEAHTEYRIVKEYADGTADLLLYPHTGRTHQLRVHCAHTLGLGRPILGDLLYGAHTAKGASAALTEIHREPGSAHHAEPIPSPTTGVYQEFSQTPPSRLCLHALSITFRHPNTGIPTTFTSSRLCY